MLLLTRKLDESIMIDDDISITIREIRRGAVKLSITYPKSRRVLRKEVYEKIQKENQSAASATAQLTTILGGKD